jgi:hypothetical protein
MGVGYTLRRRRVILDEHGTPWLEEFWYHRRARLTLKVTRLA